MSTFNDDRSFYIARLSTRMFDSVAKHVEDNKPSGWTIVDDTNIDYTDENLKLTISIFSSKDAIQVLVNWGEDHSKRIHFDSWDDVFDYIAAPAIKFYDGFLGYFFIDVINSQGA